MSGLDLDGLGPPDLADLARSQVLSWPSAPERRAEVERVAWLTARTLDVLDRGDTSGLDVAEEEALRTVVASTRARLAAGLPPIDQRPISSAYARARPPRPPREDEDPCDTCGEPMRLLRGVLRTSCWRHS